MFKKKSIFLPLFIFFSILSILSLIIVMEVEEDQNISQSTMEIQDSWNRSYEK